MRPFENNTDDVVAEACVGYRVLGRCRVTSATPGRLRPSLACDVPGSGGLDLYHCYYQQSKLTTSSLMSSADAPAVPAPCTCSPPSSPAPLSSAGLHEKSPIWLSIESSYSDANKLLWPAPGMSTKRPRRSASATLRPCLCGTTSSREPCRTNAGSASLRALATLSKRSRTSHGQSRSPGLKSGKAAPAIWRIDSKGASNTRRCPKPRLAISIATAHPIDCPKSTVWLSETFRPHGDVR